MMCILIESSKEQHLFETEIFCNILNVFTVTFVQFNAFLQKNLVDLNLLNVSVCVLM